MIALYVVGGVRRYNETTWLLYVCGERGTLSARGQIYVDLHTNVQVHVHTFKHNTYLVHAIILIHFRDTLERHYEECSKRMLRIYSCYKLQTII